MAEKLLGRALYLALAVSVVLLAGVVAGPQQSQAQTLQADPAVEIELLASAAGNALAVHCTGSTRGVFRTFRGWLDFMVTNARNLTGRSFEDDLIACSQALPNLGTEGYSALVALAGICDELRANAATCGFVRRQQNLFITVRN